jgi:hypothetical protein
VLLPDPKAQQLPPRIAFTVKGKLTVSDIAVFVYPTIIYIEPLNAPDVEFDN